MLNPFGSRDDSHLPIVHTFVHYGLSENRGHTAINPTNSVWEWPYQQGQIPSPSERSESLAIPSYPPEHAKKVTLSLAPNKNHTGHRQTSFSITWFKNWLVVDLPL